jgi:1,4-alpha-glucan branching enzyme
MNFLRTALMLMLLAISHALAIPANPTIYELNVRQASPSGTIKACIPYLDRLSEMGFDIIWLMPTYPIGHERRKGEMGSPYSVRDYRAVNPDMGTVEDLRAFVERAHELGMIVILDWVANHCAWDNPIVRSHPEWLTRNEQGEAVSPVPDWSDVVDFNYDKRPLWDWMLENMLYWIFEADVDGFRCDVAGMVPLEFWEYSIPILRQQKELFMLAEWQDPALHPLFDASYNWNLYHAFNDIYAGKYPAAVINEILTADAERYPPGIQRMSFISNHDENSWNGTSWERLGEATNLFRILSYLLPGMPLVYSGQEVGLNHRLSFFDKDQIPWPDGFFSDRLIDYEDYSIADTYRLMNMHKEREEFLQTGCAADGGWRILRTVGDDPHALVFERIAPNGDFLLGIFNLSDRSRTISSRDDLADRSWYVSEFQDVHIRDDLVQLYTSPWNGTFLRGKLSGVK